MDNYTIGIIIIVIIIILILFYYWDSIGINKNTKTSTKQKSNTETKLISEGGKPKKSTETTLDTGNDIDLMANELSD